MTCILALFHAPLMHISVDDIDEDHIISIAQEFKKHYEGTKKACEGLVGHKKLPFQNSAYHLDTQ